MSTIVYLLCAAASMVCAVLLGLGARRARSRMLVWSATCFGLLALANIVLVFDYLVLPGVPLWPLRQGLSLLAMGSLVYGLVFEEH